MTGNVVCFVDEEGRGQLCCPYCGGEERIDIAANISAGESFTETCSCGMAVSGRYSFWLSARKPVRLSGYYRVCDGSRQEEISVKEVSARKAVFTCAHAESLFPCDMLDLVFHLENDKRTLFTLPVVVTRVYGMRVIALRWDIHRYLPRA